MRHGFITRSEFNDISIETVRFQDHLFQVEVTHNSIGAIIAVMFNVGCS